MESRFTPKGDKGCHLGLILSSKREWKTNIDNL